MGWVTEHAPLWEDLNGCIQCGLCLPVCPTFRLTGQETASPRGRLTAMSAVALGMSVDDRFAGMMGLCLQCRACETACPSFVPFGRAMEGARAEVAAQAPGAGRRVRRLVTTRLLRSRRALRFLTLLAGAARRTGLHRLAPRALRASLTALRPPPRRLRPGLARPATGRSRGRAALLSGCVMDVWFPDVHEAAADLLSRAGYEVIVPPAQTCCGALAAHDGWADEARRMAQVNRDAFREADLVVADAAGCGAHLKEYGHWTEGGEELAAKTADITEVVAAAIADGRLPRLPEVGREVAVQDPCHLRHAQSITDQPRAVLAAAGLRPVEIDPGGQCCGAAGLYSVLEPEMSAMLGRAKADQVRVSGADTVASANPGCEIQLRTFLGREVRVAHPVELYREALAEAGR